MSSSSFIKRILSFFKCATSPSTKTNFPATSNTTERIEKLSMSSKLNDIQNSDKDETVSSVSPNPLAQRKSISTLDYFTRMSMRFHQQPLESKIGEVQPKQRGNTDADPAAIRDLENTSPTTVSMCSRYPCHFCIYLPSNGVDENLFPFRRQERLVEAKKTVLDEVDRQEFEAEPGVQDAMRDRRLIHIERSTECEIRLGEINGRLTVKKGIPRRRLTIAGPTFAHICVALQMLEKAFPHQMQYALYPYRLPVSVSSNYQTDERMNIPSTMLPGPTPRMPGVMSLVNNTNETGGWKKYLPSKNPQNKI